jgi:hypothetical protein
MEKARRQAYVLVALVALLAVVLYVTLGGNDPAGTPAPQAGTAAAPSNQAVPGGGRGDLPVTGLKLEALKHGDEALAESERNPFRFKPKAPPPPPPRPAPPPQVFVPQQPTGPPPPPPIPLRYIGYLGVAPQLTAVLSDARGNPVYGKEGEIVDGRYRVLRITADSVDVAYADGRGRQTLRLSSQ